MKKKIRDLTEEDIYKVCAKYHGCRKNCPFIISEEEDSYCITNYLDLDKEVEID